MDNSRINTNLTEINNENKNIDVLNSILENLCITDSIDNITDTTKNNINNDNEIDTVVLQLDSMNIKHNFVNKKTNNDDINDDINNNINFNMNTDDDDKNILAKSELKENNNLLNQNILKYYNFDNFRNKCNDNNFIYNEDGSVYELVCLNETKNDNINVIKNLKQIILYLINNKFVINSIYFKDNKFRINAINSNNVVYDLSIDLERLQFIRDKRIKYFLKNNNFIKYCGIVKVDKKTITKRRKPINRSCKYYFKNRYNDENNNMSYIK